jgi:carboxymethylenebutenolidase
MNEKVMLEVGDGTKMQAYVAKPEGNLKAGIIIFQEAFGVNHYIQSVADRFAGEGYLAIAPELFHQSGDSIEIPYTNLEGTRQYTSTLTTEGLEADVTAAHAWLKTHGCEKVVSIGFCMGGRVSYMANSILPLSAAVSFYGGGIAPDLLDRAEKISGPMLFFWGGLDTHIPPEQWTQVSDALKKAGKDEITVEMGNAKHGFFCNEREAYHEPSARLAWPLVLNFLSQKLS